MINVFNVRAVALADQFIAFFLCNVQAVRAVPVLFATNHHANLIERPSVAVLALKDAAHFGVMDFHWLALSLIISHALSLHSIFSSSSAASSPFALASLRAFT